MQKILLTLALTLMCISCSHLSNQKDPETLVYDYWGTKIHLLEKKSLDSQSFNDYEKQVQISQIVLMKNDDYKTWLTGINDKFTTGFSDPSMFRYVGRDLYLKASALEKFGQIEKAEGLFSLVFQHFGVTEEALVHYAILVLKLGDLEKARVSMKAAFDQTKDFNRRVDLAQVWLNISEALGDQVKLNSDFHYLMQKTASESSICARYGKHLNEVKKTSMAIDTLQHCNQLQTKLEDRQTLSLELAKIYISKQEFAKAQDALSPFRKLKNVNADIVLLTGMLMEQDHQVKNQMNVYTEYMKNGGTDSRILERLADYQFERNALKEGIEPLKILADEQPKNVNYKIRLALAYLQLGNAHLAADLLDEAKKMGANSPQINLYMFKAYAAMGRGQEGLSFLKVFDSDDATKMEALSLIGDYFTGYSRGLTNNQLQLATQQWEEFLGKFSSLNQSMEWTLQSAMVSEAKGDIESAIQILESAKHKNDFKEFHAYYLASLYETENAHDKADSLLREIVQQNPNFAHAWNFLGYAQLERADGDLKQAKMYILKALSIDPQSPHFRDSLGWYYFKSGQYSTALKELQLAFSLNSKDVAIGRHLIQVMMAMELNEQAKEMVKKLSQNFPGEDFKDFIQKLQLDRVPASE